MKALDEKLAKLGTAPIDGSGALLPHANSIDEPITV